jgi:hypothetical protein
MRISFDVDLFHHRQHLALQSPDPCFSFAAVDDSSETIQALVHFHVIQDTAYSPLRAPYGSFLISEKFSEQDLTRFVCFTESQLALKGVRKIVIKNPPDDYVPDVTLKMRSVFLLSGYSIVRDEVSALLMVTEKSFEQGLHRSKKSRLRKCEQLGMKFELRPLQQLKNVYDYLLACRQAKGYGLSMTYQQLQDTVQHFPDHFILSVVQHNQTWVAASIAIRVRPNVLYNFYYDHSEQFDRQSPVVLLTKGLYDYCRHHRISILDLGISLADGLHNPTLLNFKLDLGARPGRKLTFEKNM